MSIAGFYCNRLFVQQFFLVAFSINSFKLSFFRFLSLWSDRYFIFSFNESSKRNSRKIGRTFSNSKLIYQETKSIPQEYIFSKFIFYFYTFDVWWHRITFSKKRVTALTFLIWLRGREKEFFNIIWFDWKAISWLLQSIVRLFIECTAKQSLYGVVR